MRISFETWLRDKHCEVNPHLFDDELVDHFPAWLDSIDPEDIIKYAEEWAKEAK
jgi:hypothetical protein